MKKRKLVMADADDLRPEYDFSQMKGVRGKYYERVMAGTNLVVIQPDIFAEFSSGEAVNKALRDVIRRRRKTRLANNGAARAGRKGAKAHR